MIHFSPLLQLGLLLFMIWICITYVFSYNVEGSTDMLKKVMKIDFMILVSIPTLEHTPAYQHICLGGYFIAWLLWR